MLEHGLDHRSVALVQLGFLVVHRARQATEDLGVGQRVAQRLDRLHLGRKRQVEIGRDEIVELEEARRRQHVVGEVGGVGREQVDRDRQQVFAPQRGMQARLLGIRGGDVDVPAEERLRPFSVLEGGDEIHVTDRVGGVPAEVRRSEIVLVDPARLGPVQVEESGARLAQVARQGGQERAGSHDVPAGPLPLEALAEPEKRRAPSVDSRSLLDQIRRNPGHLLAPGGRTGRDHLLERLPADRVFTNEGVVEEALLHDHMQQRKREGRIAAGERLEMQVRRRGSRSTHRINDDDSSRRFR